MAEKKSADFEQSLERLESLVEEMEGGELSLEAMKGIAGDIGL